MIRWKKIPIKNLFFTDTEEIIKMRKKWEGIERLFLITDPISIIVNSIELFFFFFNSPKNNCLIFYLIFVIIWT